MKRSLLLLFVSLQLFAQPTQWQPRGIGGGGAVFSPSISPFNGNRMFLACDMGHISETNDFGKSWTTISFRSLQGSHRTNIQYTSDSLVLYALRQSHLSSAYSPAKSTDGGKSWKPLGVNPAALSANKLFSNPHSTQQIVISDKNKIYFSNNGGSTFGNAIYTDNTVKGMHLAGAFFADSLIALCVNKGLIVSTNSGVSWSSAVEPIGGIDMMNEEIVSFNGAKQGSTILFSCVTLTASVVTPKIESDDHATEFKNVYTLHYGETTWTKRTAGLSGGANDLPFFVAMMPTDTATFYLGGAVLVNVNGQHQLQTVFKTTDGGVTWTNTFLTASGFLTNNNIHSGWNGMGVDPSYNHSWYGPSMVTGITVDPKNVNRLAVSNGSVIHVSTTGGASWVQAYVDPSTQLQPSIKIPSNAFYKTSGLETAPTYWMYWVNPNTIITTHFDLTATKSTDGGNTWTFDLPGLWVKGVNDVSKIIKHPENGILYVAAGDYPGSNGDMTDGRVANYIGRISYSTNNGNTWMLFKDFGKSVIDLLIDPNNQNKMYATIIDTINGIGGVYVCDSLHRGITATWRRLSVPQRTEGRATGIHVMKNGNLLVSYGARDKGNFQFAQSAGVFYSTDGGSSWMDSTAQSMKFSVNSVTIDPNDTTENTWWACVGSSGTTQPGLYRTTNKGLVWTRLYDTASSYVSFHPALKNTMYLSGERNGLTYVTATESSAPVFTPLSEFPFRAPHRVFFNPYDVNEVWVTTFGNGLYVGTTNLTSVFNEQVEKIPHNFELMQNFPNPFNPSTVINYQLPENGMVMLKVYDAIGREVATLVNEIKEAGYYNVQLSMNKYRLSSGVYFYRLQAGNFIAIKKLMLLK